MCLDAFFCAPSSVLGQIRVQVFLQTPAALGSAENVDPGVAIVRLADNAASWLKKCRREE